MTGARERPVTADEAITELYAVHWAGLVRLAWLLVRDEASAEDIVQDAFVAVHRRWGRLRNTDRALPYLRRAVVNGARSTLRHRTVHDSYVSRAAHDTAQGPGGSRSVTESAEGIAAQRSERDAMLTAVAALPARQREVLVLRYYGGFDERSIADALDISRGAVKTHAHRGIAALRASLAHTPDGDDR